MLATNDITRGLFAYLATVSGLPQTYYIDSTAEVLDDHLRAYILPAINVSNGFEADSCTKQTGILQINIFVKAGRGANIKSGDYLDVLFNAFKKGDTVGDICFNKPPQSKPPFAHSGFLMTTFETEYTILS